MVAMLEQLNVLMVFVNLRRQELRMACCSGALGSSVQTFSRYHTTLKLIVVFHNCCMILLQGGWLRINDVFFIV